ncbi:hypothetical protein BZL30_1710 [Mycobacterium kansasii]|uniref:Uncharacterized protein n=1 Tax=Mycobacterium kansasii TaxID=1768 RepID=A0A1V3XN21_MYCKA|nr:hypothetical protein BZL30_1710 [Mycobacterium kansasii]OOK80542.1 hypothetical protein BZL29_1764 [Mycobacterium kansasii]
MRFRVCSRARPVSAAPHFAGRVLDRRAAIGTLLHHVDDT